jgi:hypothetical protein
MNIYKFHSDPYSLDFAFKLATIHPEFAYDYAKDVIKGRFPEGEQAIAKSSKYAYMYAKDVIKGRWPEGEAAIAKHAWWSYGYAIHVIKERFPAGEEAISYSGWAYSYERTFDVEL